jgi:hypothetical protein
VVNKSELQKLYEKFAMIAQHPDKLGVMVAEEGSGQHRIVLTIAGEGEAQTPVAILLTKRDIRDLQPVFNPTLGEEFRANLELEDRRSLADFDDERVMREFNPGLQPRHLA